jgi:hypothetical protein
VIAQLMLETASPGLTQTSNWAITIWLQQTVNESVTAYPSLISHPLVTELPEPVSLYRIGVRLANAGAAASAPARMRNKAVKTVLFMIFPKQIIC